MRKWVFIFLVLEAIFLFYLFTGADEAAKIQAERWQERQLIMSTMISGD